MIQRVIPIPHLSSADASKRLAEYGPNILRETAKQTPLGMFIDQFKNILVIMLMAAAILSFILGDQLDGILIIAIIVLNAILGFVQEFKAEKALAALKQMTVGMVKVMRDGVTVELPSSDIVPGDVIFLEEGDKIPADGKLVDVSHLEVNEAALTGESLPIAKDLKKENKIFMGTIVALGRATAVVTQTGMRTKFGAIAEKLGEIKDEETPLEKKMGVLGKQLGIVALVAAGIIFVLGFLRHDPLFESILTAISLAVAAVPEGLPAVVTIALAVGTQAMVRQKSILRKLAAIESLGSVTVIATDKTGTLTQNDMRVTNMWMDGTSYAPTDLEGSQSKTLSAIIDVAVHCNNASISRLTEDGTPSVIGDKTEGSLLLLAHSIGIPPEERRAQGKRIEEFPFNADLKMMTVIREYGSTRHTLTKGAPESVLSVCDRYIANGKPAPLTPAARKAIEKAFRAFAAKGLRMIAFARDDIAWKNQSRERVESSLIFLGFVGIADPARPEVIPAIAKAKKAGIATLMITGDNELTAKTIGEEVGLLSPGDTVITGATFAEMNDTEAKRALKHIRIVARATPEQKYRIVKLLQGMGHVVAVTGDGVNDALALKQADVGVAMGITGTDVAKEAADMIITDDNYASLVVAIEEGRTIFDNIKSTTKYLIGCNLGEIGAITGGVLLGWPFILSPLHILYVNLATDGLPAIGLALTPKQGDIMKRAPRTEKSIFNKHDFLWFVEVGLLTTAATLVSFYLGARENLTLGRTLAFLAIILAQQYIFYDIAARNKTILNISPKKFPWALLPIAIIIAQVILLEIPFFERAFDTIAPPVTFSIASVAITSALLIASELRKKYGKHLYYHH